jgi:site-specific DNA recombinase
MQIRDLRQLAQQRGFEIVAEYCDEGVRGSCDSRPQLDRMLADAQRGKFQAVLIWRLDRLGRSLQHLVRLERGLDLFRGGLGLLDLDGQAVLPVERRLRGV